MANAFKPAVIDDTAYLWFARQIVQTPGEPFGPPPDGFWLIWYDRGQPAYTLLIPMAVPYWIALGMTLFGEHLLILKIWLFPFCLLFTASIYSLLRRFACGWERPLLALTVFSPTFLPSLNVMIDVPALALHLTAIAIFIRALDGSKPRWRLIVLAGLLAGLAAQTKYTGATTLAVLCLHGMTRRNWIAAVVAIAIAVALFVGWEAYLSHVYGRSHFLLHLDKQRIKAPAPEGIPVLERWRTEIGETLEKKANMTVPLFGYLGGLGLPLIPLFLLGIRTRPRAVHYFCGILYAGFLLTMLLPTDWSELHRDERNPHFVVTVGTAMMGVAGIWFVLLLGRCCGTLAFRSDLCQPAGARWFLIGWLLIEVAAFYVLSPFSATRRMMGVMAAATIIAGRVLNGTLSAAPDICTRDISHRGVSSATSISRPRVLRYCAVGVGIGAIFAWTDYRDAIAERRALLAGIELVREHTEVVPRVWFTGHWGFQYYGERHGLRTIYPDESIIEEGDWIIIPDTPPRPYAQPLLLEEPFASKRFVAEIFDSWPLSTNPIYYDGYMPIRRHDGYRLRIALFRANQRFLARAN